MKESKKSVASDPRQVNPSENDIARFRKRFTQLDPDKCWPWSGIIDPDGYGVMWFNGRNVRAHRLAWLIAKGVVPHGLCVCHSCDNPPCVNPNHLWIGTNEENSADRIAKGRNATGARTRPNRIMRGITHYKTRLTEDDVRSIRRRRAAGEIYKTIGIDYGISICAVWRICTYKSWAHIA